MSGRLERIWRKRVHRGPMDPLQEVVLETGRGLEGNANQGGMRQITVISRERLDAIAEEMGRAVEPVWRRANLLVSGIELRDNPENVVRMGACRLVVRGETRGCVAWTRRSRDSKDSAP